MLLFWAILLSFCIFCVFIGSWRKWINSRNWSIKGQFQVFYILLEWSSVGSLGLSAPTLECPTHGSCMLARIWRRIDRTCDWVHTRSDQVQSCAKDKLEAVRLLFLSILILQILVVLGLKTTNFLGFLGASRVPWNFINSHGNIGKKEGSSKRKLTTLQGSVIWVYSFPFYFIMKMFTIKLMCN